MESQKIDIQANPEEEINVLVQTSSIKNPGIMKNADLSTSVEKLQKSNVYEAKKIIPEDKNVLKLPIETKEDDILPTDNKNIQYIEEKSNVESSDIKSENINVILDEESKYIQESVYPLPQTVSMIEESLTDPTTSLINVENKDVILSEDNELTDLKKEDKYSTVVDKTKDFLKSERQLVQQNTDEISSSIPEARKMILSSPETTTTTEPSFEIEIEAIVEICSNSTPDSTSQDVTMIEELSEEENLKEEKKKNKRHRNKTVEIQENILIEDKSKSDSLFQKSFTQDLDSSDSKVNEEYIIEAISSKKNYIDQPIIDKEIETEDKITTTEIPSEPCTFEKQCEQIEKLSDVQSQQTLPSIKTKLIKIKIEKTKKIKKSSHLSNVLFISTLESSVPQKSSEDNVSEVKKNLQKLKNAIENKNVILIEETTITIVEILSNWLETIESKIYVGKEYPSGPSHSDKKNFANLKENINRIENEIKTLDEIWCEAQLRSEESEKIRQCIFALKNKVKGIEAVADDGELHLTTELKRWDDFDNAINNTLK